MENRYVTVDTEIFRSKWLPVAAILTILATLLSLSGIVMLFHPEYAANLEAELAGIASADARVTWRILYMGTTVLGFSCAGLFAVSLTITVKGDPGKGMSFLYCVSQVLHYIVCGVGVILAVTLAYRVIRYVASCMLLDTGAYMIYSMLVSEAILVVLVGFLFVHLRRFTAGLSDASASMAFTLSTGKVDPVPIPAYVASGFLVLGILCMVISIDRLVTLTVVEDITGAYYKLLLLDVPIKVPEGFSYLCSGFANFILCGFVRRYKRLCERTLYNHRRQLLFGNKK